MTFAELVVAVHDWMRRLPPVKVRDAIRCQLESEEGVEGFRRGISVDAVLVMIRMGLGPGMRPVALHDLGREAARKDEPSKTAIASEPPSKPEAEPEAVEHVVRREWRGRPSKRAKALVREQLADGPKPGEDVRAAAHLADISERSLIAAASALGVRTRKGQWWLPTALPARAGRVAAAIACAAAVGVNSHLSWTCLDDFMR
jgi:hypothetical protein